MQQRERSREGQFGTELLLFVLQGGLSTKLIKKVVKVVTAFCKRKSVSTPFKVMAHFKRSVLKGGKDAPCRTFKIDGEN